MRGPPIQPISLKLAAVLDMFERTVFPLLHTLRLHSHPQLLVAEYHLVVEREKGQWLPCVVSRNEIGYECQEECSVRTLKVQRLL